ncbi:MAG: VirB3 family type IV secretion system protein [Snodgrassella sp.]|uniref:VirB3 family type IV secretion system protein n=1 Tax=Snodgrassella sp. TaxID=2815304 RepID=UPI00258D5CF4|nr:VirB3 family type IV secretion system protein [Snodgrassella sp.]MCO6520574.1 VirB3 family type IV secretion system protein [Snodgrassella sp.]
MNKEDINFEHLTYSGLNRQVMLFGVPLTALAACLLLTVLVTSLLMPFLEGKALFLLLFPLPVIAFMHSICKNDDQALRIVFYECKCSFRRRNVKLFNKTTTILSTKFGRQINDYQRFLEQHTQETTSWGRLSTESIPTRHT